MRINARISQPINQFDEN